MKTLRNWLLQFWNALQVGDQHDGWSSYLQARRQTFSRQQQS